LGLLQIPLKSTRQAFSKNIQRILLEEVEAGTLEPAEYENRRNELIGIATSNLENMITLTEANMGDILLQDANAPLVETATQPLEQKAFTTEEEKKEFEEGFKGIFPSFGRNIAPPNLYDETVVKPFETLLGKFKTIKQETGRKAFFGLKNVMTEVNVPFTDVDIDRDRAEMIKGINNNTGSESAYREALSYSLYTYGTDYNEDPEETMRLLEISGLDPTDVAIFTDNNSIREFATEVDRIGAKMISTLEPLSKEEEVTIDNARMLGLIPSDTRNFKEALRARLARFESVQRTNLNRN
jgi:hypothetical protein